VDAQLIGDKAYASMGKHPANRVKKLLGKLHSIKNSQERGSRISVESKSLLNKFVQQVEGIFKNLLLSRRIIDPESLKIRYPAIPPTSYPAVKLPRYPAQEKPKKLSR
jgi:hypothetical protein